MHSVFKFALGVAVAGILSASPVSAQSTATSSMDSGGSTERTAEAIRDHLDEVEGLVDSLLEWRHVVTWRGDT